jgi:hypothetical protein
MRDGYSRKYLILQRKSLLAAKDTAMNRAGLSIFPAILKA